MPVEARAFQGQRAGSRHPDARQQPWTSRWPSRWSRAGYLTWCAYLFVVDARGFELPAADLPVPAQPAGTVVLFGYFTTAWATTGRTYGNHLMGLRVVNYRGERMRWAGAAVRAAFCLAFPIGLFWAVVSPTNSSVQDTVLRTSVIYDWTTAATGTFDRRRARLAALLRVVGGVSLHAGGR